MAGGGKIENMEKLPHQEYRDELANKLKEIRNSNPENSEITKAEAQGYLKAKKETAEYQENKDIHKDDVSERVNLSDNLFDLKIDNLIKEKYFKSDIRTVSLRARKEWFKKFPDDKESDIQYDSPTYQNLYYQAKMDIETEDKERLESLKQEAKKNFDTQENHKLFESEFNEAVNGIQTAIDNGVILFKRYDEDQFDTFNYKPDFSDKNLMEDLLQKIKKVSSLINGVHDPKFRLLSLDRITYNEDMTATIYEDENNLNKN